MHAESHTYRNSNAHTTYALSRRSRSKHANFEDPALVMHVLGARDRVRAAQQTASTRAAHLPWESHHL